MTKNNNIKIVVIRPVCCQKHNRRIFKLNQLYEFNLLALNGKTYFSLYLSFSLGPMRPAGLPLEMDSLASFSCRKVASDNDLPLLIPLQSRKNPNSQSKNTTLFINQQNLSETEIDALNLTKNTKIQNKNL